MEEIKDNTQNQKPKGKMIFFVIIIVVVLIGGFFLYTNTTKNTSNSQSTAQSVSGNTQASQTTSNQKVKLADTQYWSYAYLISGDTLDTNAQTAISGFSIKKQAMSDGSLNITLTATQAGYQDQNYIVPTGYKLYFIETSMGDDSPPNGEYSLGDDTAVLVDSNGYIVNPNG